MNAGRAALGLGDSTRLSLGISNLFDEDPSVCDACGVVGMSAFHDLPGTFG